MEDTPRGAEEAAEESRRQAILAEKEIARAAYHAKQEAAAKALLPVLVKAKPVKRKKA